MVVGSLEIPRDPGAHGGTGIPWSHRGGPRRWDLCPRGSQQIPVTQVIGGNEDPEGVVLKDLAPPPVARALRVYPRAPRAMSVCLRLELYGCPWEGECHLVTPLSPPCHPVSPPPHPITPQCHPISNPKGVPRVVVLHPRGPHSTPWWPHGDVSPVPSRAPVLHGTTGPGDGPRPGACCPQRLHL